MFSATATSIWDSGKNRWYIRNVYKQKHSYTHSCDIHIKIDRVKRIKPITREKDACKTQNI